MYVRTLPGFQVELLLPAAMRASGLSEHDKDDALYRWLREYITWDPSSRSVVEL